MDGIAAVVPVREGEAAPAADTLAIERLAVALKRYRSVVAWNEMHGRLDEKTGETKSSARYELEAERAFDRALAALGLTPESRFKLGLRLMQAEAFAEDAEANRRARERLDKRFEAADLGAGSAAAEKRNHEQRQSGHDGDDPQHDVVEDQEGDPGGDQNDSPDPLPKLRRAHDFHGESVSAKPRQGQ